MNKFQALQFIINRNLDIILFLETKMNDSFPSAQFILKNFGIPYRLDRNSNGGGLFLYIREDILSKFLKVKSACNIESICVEVNFLSNHLECLNHIDEYSKLYISCFWETSISL